jgi:CTP synthase (UTP-ammonia lyase)
MISKEEITIKVPFDVAEIYRNATDLERQQIDAKITAIMKSSINTRQSAVDKLKQTMDEISDEAQERGLTLSILQSILNDDQ